MVLECNLRRIASFYIFKTFKCNFIEIQCQTNAKGVKFTLVPLETALDPFKNLLNSNLQEGPNTTANTNLAGCELAMEGMIGKPLENLRPAM